MYDPLHDRLLAESLSAFADIDGKRLFEVLNCALDEHRGYMDDVPEDATERYDPVQRWADRMIVNSL